MVNERGAEGAGGWAHLANQTGREGRSRVKVSLAEWCPKYLSEWSGAENHPGTASACPSEPLQCDAGMGLLSVHG